ncbi:unnamed protein product [Tetraodon nigroviridis]|uniref:(spotted green pufferfish) hypothetical protein n=1 Tax=Tetraodon nigroviridis TaxID=99883 RepID=Q4SSQ6_TETNG|nr:unnamed protein product [Tetraodon nigroviridis]
MTPLAQDRAQTFALQDEEAVLIHMWRDKGHVSVLPSSSFCSSKSKAAEKNSPEVDGSNELKSIGCNRKTDPSRYSPTRVLTQHASLVSRAAVQARQGGSTFVPPPVSGVDSASRRDGGPFPETKDREPGGGGEGDPQTNAFTSAGIRPWALKVRAGLNRAAPLKIQQQQHLSFTRMPRIGAGVCRREREKKRGGCSPLMLFASCFSGCF